eukprot:Rhum_TRINITY_DN14926_c0_g1::Rhum_TRINITY_DN14926_c0_g1_i1::g.128156::m.128156
MRSAVACISATLLASAVPSAVAEEVVFGVHRIKSFDGVELSANSWTPKAASGASPRPFMMFCNSWGVPSEEYFEPTMHLAEAGYITIEYESRGWWSSQGNITMAGPEDIRDHRAVADWAIQHWGSKLNASAMGTGGISYGAGISLLAAADDSRMQAVAAFSGWSSLLDALWWNHAPSLVWTDLLVEISKLVGRPEQEMYEMLNNVMTYHNVNQTIAWAELRSPLRVLDKLNARKVPVLIVNDMRDNLFHSNFQVELWEKLQGPKRLFITQGTHAESELSGLVPWTHPEIWTSCTQWMDRYLKGVQNKADQAPLVRMTLSDHVDGLDFFKHTMYSSWPPVDKAEGYHRLSYGLQSKNVAKGRFGVLTSTAASQGIKDTITYTNETVMTTGIPVITPVLTPLFPGSADLLLTNPKYELVFHSPEFTADTRLCGNVFLKGLVVTANQPRFNVMGYMFVQHPEWTLRSATYLTHGPMDVWTGATPGQPHALRDLSFHTACRDIRKGERLVVGINMHNILYKMANEDRALTLEFDYSNAKLDVPFVVTPAAE